MILNNELLFQHPVVQSRIKLTQGLWQILFAAYSQADEDSFKSFLSPVLIYVAFKRTLKIICQGTLSRFAR